MANDTAGTSHAPKQTPIAIHEITASANLVRCPHCIVILALVWFDEFEMLSDEAIYHDGDTIFGLAEKLVAQGLVAKQDLHDFFGTWFDYGFLVGNCPVCKRAFFGATVSMIDPASNPPPGFQDTWFHHNEPHADPVYKRVTHDRETAGEREWCVLVYDTPDCGILHEHHLGPFPWPENAGLPDHLCPAGPDTDAEPAMTWIAEHICDLWPDLRTAVVAANHQAVCTPHPDRH